jgi:hypothetical protein
MSGDIILVVLVEEHSALISRDVIALIVDPAQAGPAAVRFVVVPRPAGSRCQSSDRLSVCPVGWSGGVGQQWHCDQSGAVVKTTTELSRWRLPGRKIEIVTPEHEALSL